VKISEKISADVLIVGSGIAGLKTSLELSKGGNKVLMVTKTQLCSGSSFYPLKASLGTQVTKDQNDKSVFLQDIEEVSHGMHDKEMAKIYVEEITEQIDKFEEMGITPTKLSDSRKACFANHGRKIYMLKDWNQIRENVKQILEDKPNIRIMEKSDVISLIKENGKIAGAFLLDKNDNLILVQCKAVILASGGFGNIYKHNLNPNDVDGAGHILALEAGASLVNMEFIQFIPGFTSPKYKTLFGEHTLTYCKDFVDDHGNSILEKYLPKGLSKRECLDVRSTHGPFTNSFISKYFDIAMMKEIIKTKSEAGFELIYDERIYEDKRDFYSIYLNWLSNREINLLNDHVKIAPFAHASNGGVKIDSFGRTGVTGLFAVGELAGGIEGANRLGGNSTGACMVFGQRAANACSDYLKDSNFSEVNEERALLQLNKSIHRFSNDTNRLLAPGEIIEAVREIMWYYGNVIRDEKNLLFALTKIDELQSSYNMECYFKRDSEPKKAFKARNFLILSKLLLMAMLERRESRGAHYREDFPVENENFNKRLFISLEGNIPKLSFQ
jgi:succinate dehydrogenase/fumarate reductase flavoprotein subunit